MNVSKRTISSVIVVDLSGRLTAGDGAPTLRRTVAELIDGGARSILINMQELTLMDSSGLGELVAAKASTARVGATLKLLNVAGRIREVMVIANTLNTFAIFNDESKALASF